MFKNIISGLLITSTLLVCSCGPKDNTDPIPDYPTFSNYSGTDNNAQPTTSADTDDWNLNDLWVGNVVSVIPYISDYGNPCETDQVSSVSPAYPNPTLGTFILTFNIDQNSSVAYRVVNQDFDILASGDTLKTTSNPLNINIDISNQVVSNELVRVYYAIIKNNTCSFKGHGDIKIQ